MPSLNATRYKVGGPGVEFARLGHARTICEYCANLEAVPNMIDINMLAEPGQRPRVADAWRRVAEVRSGPKSMYSKLQIEIFQRNLVSSFKHLNKMIV
jgi:hypothetical protein